MLTRRYIRAKVLESIYACRKCGETDYGRVQRDLFSAVGRTEQLYFLLLTFLKDLQRVASDQIELSKKKYLPSASDLNPNTRFVANRFFELLNASPEIAEFERKNPKRSWDLHPEYANRVLKDVRQSLTYESYMAREQHGCDHDLDFICELFIEFIAPDASLQSFFEDIDLHWYANQAIANSMVVKTIESSRRKLRLLQVFRNEEDREFMRRLLLETLRGGAENKAHLVKDFKNWEPDRIAEIDFLIMEMAVSEFLKFPDIPERVILNEYIELARAYSTPKSKVFINGVLDKVFKRLNDLRETRTQRVD